MGGQQCKAPAATAVVIKGAFGGLRVRARAGACACVCHDEHVLEAWHHLASMLPLCPAQTATPPGRQRRRCPLGRSTRRWRWCVWSLTRRVVGGHVWCGFASRRRSSSGASRSGGVPSTSRLLAPSPPHRSSSPLPCSCLPALLPWTTGGVCAAGADEGQVLQRPLKELGAVVRRGRRGGRARWRGRHTALPGCEPAGSRRCTASPPNYPTPCAGTW